MNEKEIMSRSGFVDESQLRGLVDGDRSIGDTAVGAGSPATIGITAATVSAATAVSAFITSTGLCPTFACTGEC